ncbi:MAG TPA: glycosyl transferase family 1, partial [Pirellulales bacterium]|nr:glycosyl transferase family 1 [Pirellulales bacterium]
MNTELLTPQQANSSANLDVHVALLTNFIPPHALPVYVELARRLGRLTVLLSTPMEPNRKWQPDHATLEVRLQRTLTLKRPWKHPTGFRDTNCVHLPWDTIGAL